MARTIGIDLGTTTSIMTYMKDGKPHIIEDSQEGKIIHSIVGIHEDGSTVVGRRAKNQMLQYPERTAMEVKRLLGLNIAIKNPFFVSICRKRVNGNRYCKIGEKLVYFV